MSINPHGEACAALVRGGWWTAAAGTSHAAGRDAVRGFLGDYGLTVTAAGRTSTVGAELPPGGAVCAVALD